MQRLVPFVVALALVLGGTHLALACSSFAVYGKNGPFFGMNVDMPTRAEAAESAVGFLSTSTIAWPSTAAVMLRCSATITSFLH